MKNLLSVLFLMASFHLSAAAADHFQLQSNVFTGFEGKPSGWVAPPLAKEHGVQAWSKVDNTIWFIQYGKLYVSKDGGRKHRIRIPQSALGSESKPVHVAADHLHVYVGLDRGGFAVSRDGGASFEHRPWMWQKGREFKLRGHVLEPSITDMKVDPVTGWLYVASGLGVAVSKEEATDFEVLATRHELGFHHEGSTANARVSLAVFGSRICVGSTARTEFGSSFRMSVDGGETFVTQHFGNMYEGDWVEDYYFDQIFDIEFEPAHWIAIEESVDLTFELRPTFFVWSRYGRTEIRTDAVTDSDFPFAAEMTDYAASTAYGKLMSFSLDHMENTGLDRIVLDSYDYTRLTPERLELEGNTPAEIQPKRTFRYAEEEVELENILGRAVEWEEMFDKSRYDLVVIQTGSITSPFYMSRIEAMNALIEKYDSSKLRVGFFTLYTREAVPGDNYPMYYMNEVAARRINDLVHFTESYEGLTAPSQKQQFLIQRNRGRFHAGRFHTMLGGMQNSVHVFQPLGKIVNKAAVVYAQKWLNPNGLEAFLADAESKVRSKGGIPDLRSLEGITENEMTSHEKTALWQDYAPLTLDRAGSEAFEDYQDALGFWKGDVRAAFGGMVGALKRSNGYLEGAINFLNGSPSEESEE